MINEKADASTSAPEVKVGMNSKIVTQPPDYVLDAMRLANTFYVLVYGWKPYPPQGAK